jgi:hypothetical protein
MLLHYLFLAVYLEFHVITFMMLYEKVMHHDFIFVIFQRGIRVVSRQDSKELSLAFVGERTGRSFMNENGIPTIILLVENAGSNDGITL